MQKTKTEVKYERLMALRTYVKVLVNGANETELIQITKIFQSSTAEPELREHKARKGPGKVIALTRSQ
jgi:hypothetical protein